MAVASLRDSPGGDVDERVGEDLASSVRQDHRGIKEPAVFADISGVGQAPIAFEGIDQEV